MIARILAFLFIIAATFSASAQERLTVGTVASVENGVLLLAQGSNYFKAEGLDVDLKLYQTDQQVVAALAAGDVDMASMGFTTQAFSLAGKGAAKMIAAQAREKREFEGNNIVASPNAYARGLRKPENLAKYSIAVAQLGSAAHYQLGQIAAAAHVDFNSVVLKQQQTHDAVAKAVALGHVDVAILPALFARELLSTSQVMLIGWVSDFDESQLGALFASAKIISSRRSAIESFVRAYQHGAADFVTALLRKDRDGKRVSDAKSQTAAARIARYVYPTYSAARGTGAVEASVYYVDPQARLDAADIERQVEWHKTLGLVDRSVDVRAVMDLSFTK